ncbi:MAG: phosphoribosylanthranilate isomerase [Methermicoccaceae archaeon]
MTTRVKVCGIQREEELHAACKAGVDAIGFVVDIPQSPRCISQRRCKELKEMVPPFVTSVAVVVPQDISDAKWINRLHTDVVQIVTSLSSLPLRGDEGIEGLGEKISSKVIASVSVNDNGVMQNAHQLAKVVDALLLDTGTGGTGITHNWKISQKVREQCDVPVILAGGLRPDNVAHAIKVVRPYGVDVSSGVESEPGVKDSSLIEQFIKEVRQVG